MFFFVVRSLYAGKVEADSTAVNSVSTHNIGDIATYDGIHICTTNGQYLPQRIPNRPPGREISRLGKEDLDRRARLENREEDMSIWDQIFCCFREREESSVRLSSLTCRPERKLMEIWMVGRWVLRRTSQMSRHDSFSQPKMLRESQLRFLS